MEFSLRVYNRGESLYHNVFPDIETKKKSSDDLSKCQKN